jgi:uncharacterized repeat protein (TIGR03803 family)
MTRAHIADSPFRSRFASAGSGRVGRNLDSAREAILVWSVLLVLVSTSAAQVVANVHSFTLSTSLSANPYLVTLVQGRDGKLYGTTSGGEWPYIGSIFRLQTTGKGGDVRGFYADGINGASPFAGPTLATDGNLYGTMASGGTQDHGVLFKITPGGTYTVLHDFSGGLDGSEPFAAPIEASDGNLYGTSANEANIYKYTRAGVFSTLYQFTDGSFITAAVIQAADGNLYGTSASGGANGCGTVFKLTRAGILLHAYSFPCGEGGESPEGPLTQVTDGDFYGTTSGGGSYGVGTIFKMDPKGKITLVYHFQGALNGDGEAPTAGLVQASDGNLYGTAAAGGTFNCGMVFQITPKGIYKPLFSLTSAIGCTAYGSLMQHTNGKLYATTYYGGTFFYGSVYSLDMGLKPFVAFVRATGKVGQTVQILGQGLTGTSSVLFNGLASTSFSIVSDTYVTAVVPNGAKTGPVSVTTTTGTLTSSKNLRISQ